MASYLAGQGIDTTKPFHCLNPDHPDTHPSMRYDPRRHKVHCFSCGVDYDLLDLIAIDYHLDNMGEAFRIAAGGAARAATPLRAARAAPPLRNSSTKIDTSPSPQAASSTHHKPSGLEGKGTTSANASSETEGGPCRRYVEECRKRLGETDYHLRRGISEDTARRFGLGYDPAYPVGGGKTWRALIIPTGPDSYTARNTDPDADKTQRIRKAGSARDPLRNTSVEGGAFPSLQQPLPAKQKETATPNAASEEAGNARIACVEGEFDALSLAEAGYPAVSLGSCANAGKFARTLLEMEHPPSVLLALDDDDAGRKATATIVEALEGSGIACHVADVCLGQKDPNAALLHDREAFCQALARAWAELGEVVDSDKKAYLSNSSAAHLDAFIGGIAASVDTPVQGTGFPALDDALDGGLYEGLYIVGAITSLGKTTLVCQMADQIAQSGRDVLIFSLEMSRYELMAKSVSRLTLLECLAQGLGSGCAKTSRGITCGRRYPDYSAAEQAVITRALAAYRAYADRVFIHEGIGDIGAAQIRDTVERHIGYTGNTPVVLIDYLQILSPHSDRATDKQNTDRAVLDLKRLSRDCKLPVIGISSFNRAGYAQAVTMEAFKESGAIEYSSDVLIGLQLKGAGSTDFDATRAKRQDPRQVELVVLKNRNGRVGERVCFSYYPLFNFFKAGSTDSVV